MSSYNYKLVIAYDGTRYSGWQVQPNGIAIQQRIQQALEMVIGESIALHGSGRTDAGVHAQGQVAHFHSSKVIDLYRIQHSLNGILPKDIRILEVEGVPFDFHARYSAVSKTYHYHLWLERVESPFLSPYRWRPCWKLDLELLRCGAEAFVGTHDFHAFANEAHRGTASYDSIRTLQRLDVAEEAGGVRLEFQADGFLYKMVRNIVGTLVEIAAGRRAPSQVAELLAARDRRHAGQAAPPHGLFLVTVEY
jgi:tRNA pseudouridine38-40 synthase